MRKIFFVLAASAAIALFGCELETPNDKIYANCVIRYSSEDGNIIEPYSGANAEEFPFGEGVEIVSNVNDGVEGVITFNKEVTRIGRVAFFRCGEMTSITIPDSVTEIAGSAFSCCDKLRCFYGSAASDDYRCIILDGTLCAVASAGLDSYVIPDSVTKIGDQAFSYCSRLENITIPDSVREIGDWAFSGCSSLTAFHGKYATEDNRCLIIDGVLNSFAPAGLTSYTILDGVTTIGASAFSDCRSLESVTITDCVTTIGDYAFYYCWKLERVYCKAVNPPTLGGNGGVFYDNASGRKIYVPAQSVEAYKAAEGWSEYADAIVGYSF